MRVNKLMFTQRIPLFLILIALLTGACSASEQTVRIALLAPFEGHYREIGYNALYAVRLSLLENNGSGIELMAIDDGGSNEQAVHRAQAINHDPTIKAVLLLGPYTTTEEVQAQLDTLPTIIVGHWNASPASQNIVVMASEKLSHQVEMPVNLDVWDISELKDPTIGSELWSISQISDRAMNLEYITVVSSGILPDAGFRERYINSDIFVPEPGLIATLSYDATTVLIRSLSEGIPLSDIAIEGINGNIRFQNGYWQDAPVNQFKYSADGVLETQ